MRNLLILTMVLVPFFASSQTKYDTGPVVDSLFKAGAIDLGNKLLLNNAGSELNKFRYQTGVGYALVFIGSVINYVATSNYNKNQAQVGSMQTRNTMLTIGIGVSVVGIINLIAAPRHISKAGFKLKSIR